MLFHSDLFVSSMERSLRFYSARLGFRVVEDSTVRGDLVRYVSRGRYDAMRLVLLKVSRVGAMIELLEFERPSEEPYDFEIAPYHGCITVLVEDLDGKIRELREQGVEPSSEIYEVGLPNVGASRVVFYADPDGHAIEFLQLVER